MGPGLMLALALALAPAACAPEAEECTTSSMPSAAPPIGSSPQ